MMVVTQTYCRRAAKVSGALLMLVLVGRAGFAASFDCRAADLSKVERMICANSALSSLDSQLGSLYGVARAAANEDGKSALLRTQKAWLRSRNLCSSVQCLRAAYQVRISQLQWVKNGSVFDFAVRFKEGPHGQVPECATVLLSSLTSGEVHPDVAGTSFSPFVPHGWEVLDLRCADIKGDGSITYLLVTREPDSGQPGTLTLLTLAPGGSMHVEGENHAIIQTDAAGIEGGYGGIILLPKGFVVESSIGGGGVGNTYKFTFHYSTAARTWMLQRIDVGSFGGSQFPPQHLTTATLGKVTFDEFDATQYDATP